MADSVELTQAQIEALVQEDETGHVSQVAAEAIALPESTDVRASQVMLEVLYEYPFTNPLLLQPDTDVAESITDSLRITYIPGLDEEGDPGLHTFRYRPIAGGAWTIVFEDVEPDGPEGVEFIEAVDLVEGEYEFEFWAEWGAEQSPVTRGSFFVNLGSPHPITILTPVGGQGVRPLPFDVTWEPPTDPDGDSVTVFGRYRRIGDSGFIDLFNQPDTDPEEYEWDLTGFAADDYELELYAHDGNSAGPARRVQFTVTEQSRPDAPAVRIAELGDSTVRPEAREYSHPFNVAWQATQYQVRPWNGSWDNLSLDITTTEPSEQLTKTLGPFASGFVGEIRMRFQDEDDQWGGWSLAVRFDVLSGVAEWERRWNVTHEWIREGSRWRGVLDDESVVESMGALVRVDVPEFGSCRGSCDVGIAGFAPRFITPETEFRIAGGGLFSGTNGADDSAGIAIYARTGVVMNIVGYEDTPPGGGKADLWIEMTIRHPSIPGGQHTLTVSKRIGEMLTWIEGEWSTHFSRLSMVRVQWDIQRHLDTRQTVVKGRILGLGLASDFVDPVGSSGWHITATWPYLLCGRPGYVIGQKGLVFTGVETICQDLTFVAKRDLGVYEPVTVDPHGALPDDVDPPCVPITEPAPEDPVLFPLRPNEPGIETMSWLTDIIEGRDETEQRVQLRQLPRTVVAYDVIVDDGEKRGALQAATDLVWSNQTDRWAVPMWMDAVYLTEDLGSGAGSIPASAVDTDGRRFDEVAYVALWADAQTHELFPATLEEDGSITLDGTTSQDFSARRTIVLPCRVGRMIGPSGGEMLNYEATDGSFEFHLEAIAPLGGSTPSSYAGHPLLEFVPNRARPKDQLTPSSEILESPTGVVAVEPHGDRPVPEREVSFVLDGRTEIADFRAFLQTVRGRGEPFWYPMWTRDFVQTETLSSGSTTLRVEHTGYEDGLFTVNARKRLALILPDRSFHPVHVSGVTDLEDGRDALTISPSLPVNFPESGGVVSFLALYRLASDDVSLTWLKQDVVEVTLRLQELTWEAPAP